MSSPHHIAGGKARSAALSPERRSEIARAAAIARWGKRHPKVKTRETMWAEMKPDCYGGKTFDQIVPRWNIHCDGDKQDENLSGPITLAPRTFPPGTRVVVHEPVCPKCGEGRSQKYPTPKRGPLFDDKCDCGFDWKAWTLGEYS